MNVLLLTPRYPHQQLGGGLVKTYKIIEYLSVEFNLKTFCLNVEITHENIDGDLIETPLPHNVYKPSIYNLLKSYVLNLPLSVVRNRVSEPNVLSELLDWCDVILVDHFIMYQYVPLKIKKPIYLHQHNAEYIIWKRSLDAECNLIKKILLKMESIRVAKFEREICQRSKVVFASPNDIEQLLNLGLSPDKFSKTYHLGDDSLLNYAIPEFKYMESNITFLGNLSWGPNFDGIIWFLDEIWLDIINIKPDARLNIVGACDEEKESILRRYPNVIVHGFVHDLNVILSNTRVFISPLRYGSGMKVKNITAMYRGLPIVTTDIGAEGINLIDKESALIANDIEAFLNSVVLLLADDDLCVKLANFARNLAKTHYGWNSNMSNIVRVIRDGN